MPSSRILDRRGRRANPWRRWRGAPETFGDWLDEELRRLYEAELAEPIPEAMLRLLDMLDAAGG